MEYLYDLQDLPPPHFPCSYIRQYFQAETKQNIFQERFEYLYPCTV